MSFVFVNRWWSDGDEEFCSKTGHSQELMLRGILVRSVGRGPTIINFEEAAFRGDCDYSHHIRRVSSHYGVHYWSFMDIVWSDAINSLPEKARQELQYLVTPPGATSPPTDMAHPPWPVHLFWADLLAAALEKEFIRCNQLSVNHTPLKLRDTIERNGVIAPKLPLPLYLSDRYQHCQSDLPSLIDLSAEVLVDEHKRVDSSLGNIGTFEVTPATAWPLLEDRAEKFGWISKYEKSSSSSLLLNDSIRFNIDNAALTKLGRFNLYSHSVLNIEYLRTYENAGKANVYICGKNIATLDALYERVFIKKSVPEGFVYIHPITASEDGLSFCADKETPVIEIEHVHMDLANDKRAVARGNQKVRLIQVKLCIMDENNFAYR